MEFHLNDELIDQIIFSMEDQKQFFFIDNQSGELIPEKDLASVAEDQQSRFVAIPEWKPIDGFYLMEKFVSLLRNPIFREELKSALSAGKGVFRNFKDILKSNKDIEHHWFRFKDREMKRVVWRWYNEQRELSGLERLTPPGTPPGSEDTEDLLVSDFSFEIAIKQHLPQIYRLDEDIFAELYPEADPERIRQLYQQRRQGAPGPLDPGLALVVLTPDGEFAGFAWGVESIDVLNNCPDLDIIQIAVNRQYRGLGLGSLLLQRFLSLARNRGYDSVHCVLEGNSLSLCSSLETEGFETSSQVLSLNLDRWDPS